MNLLETSWHTGTGGRWNLEGLQEGPQEGLQHRSGFPAGARLGDGAIWAVEFEERAWAKTQRCKAQGDQGRRNRFWTPPGREGHPSW